MEYNPNLKDLRLHRYMFFNIDKNEIKRNKDKGIFIFLIF